MTKELSNRDRRRDVLGLLSEFDLASFRIVASRMSPTETSRSVFIKSEPSDAISYVAKKYGVPRNLVASILVKEMKIIQRDLRTEIARKRKATKKRLAEENRQKEVARRRAAKKDLSERRQDAILKVREEHRLKKEAESNEQ